MASNRLTPVSTLALALLLAACTHTGSGIRDPTKGLCSTDLARGGTPDAILSDADAALGRRCPREALAQLARLGSSQPAATPMQRGHAFLAQQEARAQALGQAVVGAAPMIPADGVPWLKEAQSLNPVAVGRRLGALKRAGHLPPASLTSGRVAKLFNRLTNGVKCLDSDVRAQVHPLVWLVRHGSQQRQQVVRETGGFVRTRPLTAQKLLVMADVPLWACHSQYYLQALRLAGDLARKAGNQVTTFDASLRLVEAEVFPGHRASGLAALLSGQGRNAQRAGYDEAAMLHTGRYAQMARVARQRLSRLKPKATSSPLTSGQSARLAWVAAVVELRLAGEPHAAEVKARELETLALQAGRADLLDGSRVVSFLALVQRGAWAEAAEVFRWLAASLDDRGAIGAAHDLHNRLLAIARYGLLRGQPLTAVGLLKLLAGEPRWPGDKRVAALLASTQILTVGGRMEEALESLEAAQALITRIGDGLGVHRRSFQAVLDGLRPGLEATLGRVSQVPAATTWLQRIVSAVGNGDTIAFKRLRQAMTDQQAMGFVLHFGEAGRCGLVSRGLPRLAALVTASWKTHLEAQPPRGGDPKAWAAALAADRASLLGLIDQVGGILGSCGAKLRQPGLVTQGRNVGRLLDFGGPAARSREQQFDAYALEAAGRFGLAARRYEAVANELVQRAGLDGRSALGLGQLTQHFYDRAVISYLLMGPPSLSRAFAVLETSRGRDLRVARAAVHVKGSAQGGIGKVAKVERRISILQGRLRALVALKEAQAASSRGTRAALERSSKKVALEIAQAERARTLAARELAARNPRAYRAAALARPPTIGKVSKLLGADEVLVY